MPKDDNFQLLKNIWNRRWEADLKSCYLYAPLIEWKLSIFGHLLYLKRYFPWWYSMNLLR
ncbi:hypothetical protein THICB1_100350 [Thiomonas arsenitoxydans]|uniref:Uncharacterized protein n=1 Tax=Thiomonas arsenitoxydans (strain DSM 22701 / CIP 110005 / 3As) TaxID=426114 RepID=A0ABM9T0Y5_THIA3|nr:hypothetical protein THICB1_100350 [Thiomonas arsenitoxydans]CQR32267.1 hypothetical protein THICB6_160149 [Thiomonas arsenitoxydans]